MRWHDCRKILVVRPDNMGDLLMSSPAIRALKETFGCSITLLTSSMARGIAEFITSVDETMVYDVPWVKGEGEATAEDFMEMVTKLKAQNFDAAVIFTVFSQNPLPTALLLTLAGIPQRLAYCRENPYKLLTDWVPEEEPYNFIRHQVKRDLDLVATIGASTRDQTINIRIPPDNLPVVKEKLACLGIDPNRSWLLMHPGASEKKREFPQHLWIAIGKRIARDLNYQVLVTGSPGEASLAEGIVKGIGENAFSVAGAFSLPEFIGLIKLSPLLISVNTGTVHLAAAVRTKTIVLYALTNPQHLPWKTIGRVFTFPVSEDQQSRNEILRHLQRSYFLNHEKSDDVNSIITAVRDLLAGKDTTLLPELIPAHGMPLFTGSTAP